MICIFLLFNLMKIITKNKKYLKIQKKKKLHVNIMKNTYIYVYKKIFC